MKFQSSPVPRDRCNHPPTAESPFDIGFNPHRSRGTGATLFAGSRSVLQRFQSSPVPRDRCNPRSGSIPREFSRFNPHRSRGTGATEQRRWTSLGMLRFQSSPVPRDRCNLQPDNGERSRENVSILTGPEGPVQRAHNSRDHSDVMVSILTGPEGPVQLICSSNQSPVCLFQSSPVPRDRCNVFFALIVGCAVTVSILTGPEGPVQRAWRSESILAAACFNPHRSRGTGATAALRRAAP